MAASFILPKRIKLVRDKRRGHKHKFKIQSE